MNKLLIFFLLLLTPVLYAGDIEIIAAKLNKQSNNWHVDVTLKHKDTGWEHYAENWRIVDLTGRILGNRVLYHPHVNEQPFSRSLKNVSIPESTKILYIEAHDKVHGWTKKRLKVDLNRANNGSLIVTNKTDE